MQPAGERRSERDGGSGEAVPAASSDEQAVRPGTQTAYGRHCQAVHQADEPGAPAPPGSDCQDFRTSHGGHEQGLPHVLRRRVRAHE